MRLSALPPSRLLPLAMTLVTSLTATAAMAEHDPLAAGRIRLSLGVGSGEAFASDYVIVGLHGGYFVVSGLEVGLDADMWLGGSPLIGKVSPQIRYALPLDEQVRPYVGAFYSHWFIGNESEDLDAVGGRAGIFWLTRSALVITGGMAFEHRLSGCSDNCDSVYPELALSLAF